MKITIDFNKPIKTVDGQEFPDLQTFGSVIGRAFGETTDLKALNTLKAWEISKKFVAGEPIEITPDEFNSLKREIEGIRLPILVKAPAILILNEAYALASTTAKE